MKPKITAELQRLVVPIETVYYNPKNARIHDTRDIEFKMQILQDFGQVQPIIIDEKAYCLGGNGFLKAARNLGWNEIAAVVMGGTKEEQMRFIVAHNRTGELSKWDTEILAETIQTLGLDALGFEMKDVKDMGLDIDISKLELPAPGDIGTSSVAPGNKPKILTCPRCGKRF